MKFATQISPLLNYLFFTDDVFEICPDDEVTFESLLTSEELLVEKAKQSASKFQLLDPISPTVSLHL